MTYNGRNLIEVLEAHKKWLAEEDGWTEGDRANLIGANLIGANLSRANLSRANLSWADLSRANLIGANLSRANLSWANLSRANLIGANLNGANLSWANLIGAKNIPFIPFACPDTGAFIAWKKCKYGCNNTCIVKLLIPECAKRLSATGRKCRSSKAMVLEIQDVDGKPIDVTANSFYNTNFEYRKGETVEPLMKFDENRWNECSSGIHFFTNRQEAVNYEV